MVHLFFQAFLCIANAVAEATLAASLIASFADKHLKRVAGK